MDTLAYRWRRMSPEERAKTLADRKERNVPWHWPAHYSNDGQHYLVTAACYEHRPHIGYSAGRLFDFEQQLLKLLSAVCDRIYAWVVLPNHYHLLVHAANLKALLVELGRLHGRTSHCWNGEESKRGRHVWHGAAETAIKSDAHFWATLNYVLNNAVRHGYVDRWQDWPYCNATSYLDEVGREEAERRWNTYPLLDYGKDWDPPEL